MTHYIDSGAIEKSAAYNPSGRPSERLRALCGALMPTADHEVEPTCPICLARLAKWDAADAAFFAKIGYVEIRPGVMGPPPQKRGTV